MEGHFMKVCLRACSLLRCSNLNIVAVSAVGQRAAASQHESVVRLSRMLSSDHRKRVIASNNVPGRQNRQNGFLESVLPNQKHLRLKQTQNRIRETQDKIKKTQQRFKESKQRILNDIKDTKTMMKERMEDIIERENIYTIPNVLCVTRIVFSPYLGYLIIQSDFNLALGLLVVAGVTDALDGWIARTWKSQSSKLGSFLDPMADKVLIATLFLSLTYVDLIPIALTSLIVVRDVALVAAGSYIRYKSLPAPHTFRRYFDATHATAQLAPTNISKFNTMVQLALVAFTLGAPVFQYVDHAALHGLWYLTAGTTVASALSYAFSKGTYKFLKVKRPSRSSKPS
ncbi:probable cardiolipin synthase (CMP-forming) [Thrips palmi]|uniref:cardiolipin synthase (CMP-forming) n=1 Tax=Thrips palmi TaxID=161013 RepID=A0A6P8ZYE2_THRPL|nr:probable cardiolipin synthase (CMP-forming) [Thrips palmi]